MPNDTTGLGWRTYAAGAALVAAGMLGGGVLASAISASAADTADAAASSGAASASALARPGPGAGPAGAIDPSRSVRPDEKLLAGGKATKAREAALAEYPGATIQRVETDSDGVYEAHLVTADGEEVVVQMDEDFAVTGTEEHRER